MLLTDNLSTSRDIISSKQTTCIYMSQSLSAYIDRTFKWGRVLCSRHRIRNVLVLRYFRSILLPCRIRGGNPQTPRDVYRLLKVASYVSPIICLRLELCAFVRGRDATGGMKSSNGKRGDSRGFMAETHRAVDCRVQLSSANFMNIPESITL
jgi:hypothetical protein